VPDVARDHAWSVADAKARLSELLDRAIDSGPQAITRRGREIAGRFAAAEPGGDRPGVTCFTQLCIFN
jgi:antitoxin (DNA-binding transcriptional repressor) of toxin-antitoxin stability system